MQQVNPGRAHNPDESDMRGILKTGNSGKVSPSVTAPITYDAYHLWLKNIFCAHSATFKSQIPNFKRQIPKVVFVIAYL